MQQKIDRAGKAVGGRRRDKAWARRARWLGIAVCLCAALAVGRTAEAADPSGRLSIELNKLEAQSTSCRAYFVIVNDSPLDIGDLQLDVFIFDTEGIISRRVAINTRRLEPGKTYIRLFDIAEQTCDGFSRLVLNEVLSCVDSAGAAIDCSNALALSSRTGVAFID